MTHIIRGLIIPISQVRKLWMENKRIVLSFQGNKLAARYVFPRDALLCSVSHIIRGASESTWYTVTAG